MNNLGTLYFFTGKMGAGKTTMSGMSTVNWTIFMWYLTYN